VSALDEARRVLDRYKQAHGKDMPPSETIALLRPAIAADPGHPCLVYARRILAGSEKLVELQAVIDETAWATPEVLAAAKHECEVAEGVVAVMENVVAALKEDPKADVREVVEWALALAS
jgi:hypothetical protein